MSRIASPVTQYLDDAGDPLINGQLHFYEVGSVTLKDTYADASLTIPNSNPVLLDGAGRTPNIYGSGTYRMKLSDSGGSKIWERDNVGSDTALGYGAEWDSTVIYNVPDVVLFDLIYYQSLTNSNIGNTPSSSPSSWEALAQVTPGEIEQIETTRVQGINFYDADTDYPADAYTKGSDGCLYFCKIDNGPTSTPVDPVGDNTGTWIKIGVTTLFENLTGVGDATVIDWTATGYILEDFDMVLLSGDTTASGISSIAGSTSTMLTPATALANNPISVSTITSRSGNSNFVGLQATSVTSTELTVSVAGQVYTGVMTGVYGIKY